MLIPVEGRDQEEAVVIWFPDVVSSVRFETLPQCRTWIRLGGWHRLPGEENDLPIMSSLLPRLSPISLRDPRP